MSKHKLYQAVLFDLDGTLADTAPDLGAALNQMLAIRGLVQVPLQQLRPHVSMGARGMIKLGFDKTPHDEDYHRLQQEFLHWYSQSLCTETALFSGIADLLDELESIDIKWGVVTNKSQRFALPVIEHLDLRDRCSCVVCGDSSPRPKPYAHPLLLACEVIDCNASKAWYIGDDPRDIHAGRAAGMRTGAAAWGYLGDSGPISQWGADRILDEAIQLLNHLR